MNEFQRQQHHEALAQFAGVMGLSEQEFEYMVSGPNGEIHFDSSAVLSWLGGKEPTQEILEEYSEYSKIDRNKWSHDIPSGFHFPNADVKQDYTQIWQGDFCAQYQVLMREKTALVLYLTVPIPSEPWSCMTIPIFFDPSINMAVYISSNSAFAKNTSETMKTALRSQVLHHFIRKHGSVLNVVDLACLTKRLHKEYKGKFVKPWKHSLDLAVAQFDVALTQQPKIEAHEMPHFLVEPAGFLQATGNKLLAAQMFSMAATKFDNKLSSSAFFIDAAHAYQQGKKYADAEKSCIKALHAATTAHGLMFNNFGIHITGILSDTYSLWLGQLKDSQGSQNEASEISLVFHTFIGLIVSCKYRPSILNSEHDQKAIVRFNNTMLQGKFKKEAAAKNALMIAIQGETAQAFRAKVLSCLKSPTAQYIPITSLEDLKYSAEGGGKTNARVRLGGMDFVGSECSCCGAGETLEKPHSSCPCRSEKYCSRDCQLAHWKQHKPFCSYAQQQKLKKETKTSKK